MVSEIWWCRQPYNVGRGHDGDRDRGRLRRRRNRVDRGVADPDEP